ncbi:hypothetical protein CARUB_v10001419mg [Capsella rubella]|uniref:Uncharacterized protein n=1 Tax=Capsella rubella TaxID=81985 RepID=R0FGJ9_9BRAS|nr:UPF0725 protein EMB2204 [Capsella rubella]EOA21081.1 hypothetical protein CARUB_v10001419mg [Capsella rubella]
MEAPSLSSSVGEIGMKLPSLSRSEEESQMKTPPLSRSEEDREKDERDSAKVVKQTIDDDLFKVHRGLNYSMSTDTYAPRLALVPLYAKLGLHRYNLLKGKDLKISSVEKYTKSTGSAASTYCITFQALDLKASSSSGLLQFITFRARVCELDYGQFILLCSVAMPLGETRVNDGGYKTTNVLNNKVLRQFMPELPSEDPFNDDTGRFYVLKESEVQENDWIRLYLELAVATSFRNDITHGMTDLTILKVAMEITRNLEPYNMGLDAYDAIFYIRYKDICKARVGKDVHRVAMVRRILNVHSGYFRIVGQTQSSQTTKPSNALEAGSIVD